MFDDHFRRHLLLIAFVVVFIAVAPTSIGVKEREAWSFVFSHDGAFLTGVLELLFLRRRPPTGDSDVVSRNRFDRLYLLAVKVSLADKVQGGHLGHFFDGLVGFHFGGHLDAYFLPFLANKFQNEMSEENVQRIYFSRLKSGGFGSLLIRRFLKGLVLEGWC